jgi:hypothetical protein
MVSFLPSSLIRQEHPTKTNTSQIPPFDTRRVQTSKRSNLEAWIQEYLKLASVACNTGQTGTGRSYFRRIELGTRKSRIYLDIWFGSDEKCVFGAVTGQELGSRRQDLLVSSQTISRLLSTQYSIYIWSCSCCFGCLVCSGQALVWEGRMWWGHVAPMHVA